MKQDTLANFLKDNNFKLEDVSNQTGLSKSTLSRIKNGFLKVSPKTKEIIKNTYDLEIIEFDALKNEQEKNKRIKQENLDLQNDNHNKDIELSNINLALKNEQKRKEMIRIITNLDNSFFSSKKADNLLRKLQKFTN